MRNIALVISYDGTAYHGWQCQPGLTTIQQVLQEKIENIVNHKVKLYGAARTDSGVHAFGQTVNFFTESKIDMRGLARGLNSQLPADIRIRSAREVDGHFHARYSAKSKTYVYSILNAPHNSPFYVPYVWHIPFFLNVPIMDTASKLVIGTHDFSAFKKKDEIYQSASRELIKAGVKRKGNFIYVVVEAAGFLRYMVRNIVGTLMLVGKGKLTVDEFKGILESKDRVRAGPTAPAKGLFLRKIKY